MCLGGCAATNDFAPLDNTNTQQFLHQDTPPLSCATPEWLDCALKFRVGGNYAENEMGLLTGLFLSRGWQTAVGACFCA